MTPPGNRINPLERLILLSADDEGRISFFEWQAMGVDANLKALALMEAAGYLRREPGDKFCRGYRLTERGMSVRVGLCHCKHHEMAEAQP